MSDGEFAKAHVGYLIRRIQDRCNRGDAPAVHVYWDLQKRRFKTTTDEVKAKQWPYIGLYPAWTRRAHLIEDIEEFAKDLFNPHGHTQSHWATFFNRKRKQDADFGTQQATV